jgi:anti-sigma factor RsiW
MGVADSADENARRRNACDVFAGHERHASEVAVDFNHDWAARFAAQVPRALAQDAYAALAGSGGNLIILNSSAVNLLYHIK